MATTTKKIGIITGSTRTLRIGAKVTAFITKTLATQLSSLPSSPTTTFALHPIDIATFSLPIYDESVIPAAVPQYASFSHTHSIAWSSEILKYDGFVLVTACYNNGPPGGVKNALDYLYHEVQGKPFMIVSYGIQGGGSAAEALKLNLETMGAKVVETRPLLKFSERGETVMGLSEDTRLASEGKLGAYSLEEWEGQRGELEMGFAEVKEFLVKAPEVKAA